VATVAVADPMDDHRLNSTLALEGDVMFSGGVQFTPDGSRVLYVADERVDNMHELFSVPTAGGESLRISPDMVESGDVLVNGILVTPDSARVVFLADANHNARFELFSAPTAGGSVVRLSPELGEQGLVIPDGMQMTSDGKHVIFLVVFEEAE